MKTEDKETGDERWIFVRVGLGLFNAASAAGSLGSQRVWVFFRFLIAQMLKRVHHDIFFNALVFKAVIPDAVKYHKIF